MFAKSIFLLFLLLWKLFILFMYHFSKTSFFQKNTVPVFISDLFRKSLIKKCTQCLPLRNFALYIYIYIYIYIYMLPIKKIEWLNSNGSALLSRIRVFFHSTSNQWVEGCQIFINEVASSIRSLNYHINMKII